MFVSFKTYLDQISLFVLVQVQMENLNKCAHTNNLDFLCGKNQDGGHKTIKRAIKET